MLRLTRHLGGLGQNLSRGGTGLLHRIRDTRDVVRYLRGAG